MGQVTSFHAARRTDLRKGGDEAIKAFWADELGCLNKAFWFDMLCWDTPRKYEPSKEDSSLISSGLHSDCECPLTVKQLEWVVAQLEELDKTVAAMPCDPKKDWARGDWKKGGMGELEFEGTPNGIAIMRKVYSVLSTRYEFFGYPWSDAEHINAFGKGTSQIREELAEVIKKFKELNKNGEYILYKTTG